MKVVGSRRERGIHIRPTGESLAEGARFNEAISWLSQSTFVPKGVYRFGSHEAANKHAEDCLVQGMARLAKIAHLARTMSEFSRPASLDDLKLLLRSLNDKGADYFLIGGYALAAHGYQRATTDIDVVVPATAQAGRRVIDALMVLPDHAAKDIDPAWFEQGENIRVADLFVIDLMLNANGQTYETLRQYAETLELDGIVVKTISLRVCSLPRRRFATKTWPIESLSSGRSKPLATRVTCERDSCHSRQCVRPRRIGIHIANWVDLKGWPLSMDEEPGMPQAAGVGGAGEFAQGDRRQPYFSVISLHI